MTEQRPRERRLLAEWSEDKVVWWGHTGAEGGPSQTAGRADSASGGGAQERSGGVPVGYCLCWCVCGSSSLFLSSLPFCFCNFFCLSALSFYSCLSASLYLSVSLSISYPLCYSMSFCPSLSLSLSLSLCLSVSLSPSIPCLSLYFSLFHDFIIILLPLPTNSGITFCFIVIIQSLFPTFTESK